MAIKSYDEWLNEGHSYDNEIENARMMRSSASELVQWAKRKIAESKPEYFKEGIISPVLERLKINKKSKGYINGEYFTIYTMDDGPMFDIKVNSSAGWSIDPHDRKREEFRLMDAGKRVASIRFKSGNLRKLAKQMHDLTAKTTWGEKNGLTDKDYYEILTMWLDMSVNESVDEAKASVTQFTKPGNDGDIYFSKREGNAIAVRNGDKLQSIYVYGGVVKLGKIHKTDSRWDNMGAPSEKLLVNLSLQNVGGINTRDALTLDGKLIYKFLSESVNESKSSKSKEAWWDEGNKETGYLIIKGRKITAELPYKTIEFKTKEEAERWFVSKGFVKESVDEAIAPLFPDVLKVKKDTKITPNVNNPSDILPKGQYKSTDKEFDGMHIYQIKGKKWFLWPEDMDILNEGKLTEELTRMISDGAMSNLHQIASEVKDEKEFVKKVKDEGEIDIKFTKEVEAMLIALYKDMTK